VRKDRVIPTVLSLMRWGASASLSGCEGREFMQILIAVVFGFVVPSLLAFLVWEWEGRRRLWRVAAIFGSMWVRLGTTHVLIGWFDVWGRT